MRILVTNDDGITAPGLVALEVIAAQLSDDVWVVAPAEEQSGAGHSLTLSKPVRLREIERVSRGARYICVEAYRNEREKMNLMYWQLTCRIFHTPAEWDFTFAQAGYTGDSEFIYFE